MFATQCSFPALVFMPFQTWLLDTIWVWTVDSAWAVWSRLVPHGTDGWSFVFGLGWGILIALGGALVLGMYLDTDSPSTWESRSGSVVQLELPM